MAFQEMGKNILSMIPCPSLRCRAILVFAIFAAATDCPAAGPPAPAPLRSASARHGAGETVKLTPPAEAAAGMTAPAGFHVSLFASEPVIRQPIGMATDSRGRLWVAENNTYSDARVNFDLSQHDRIIILEDTDHDGRADRHTVFWDQAQKLTSVEIGFGGVWALCPPRLLFIPDRNGDDIPDGQPQVVLDGLDDGVVRHNIANGLRWGPDGWLYGRHGIQATSYVGVPGTLPSQRTPLNCCIWRYHPTRKIFEVVCRGTTNPWGMDWNAEGELFFINTVIGHLWHAVPGAHFQRMYGEDDNPHVYELLGQTADHFHWDTAEHWSAIRKIGVSPTTDQAGGGHAHAGLMIYQGDNWPDRYRGQPVHHQSARPPAQQRHARTPGFRLRGTARGRFPQVARPLVPRPRIDFRFGRRRLHCRLVRHRRVPRRRRRRPQLGPHLQSRLRSTSASEDCRRRPVERRGVGRPPARKERLVCPPVPPHPAGAKPPRAGRCRKSTRACGASLQATPTRCTSSAPCGACTSPAARRTPGS